MAKGNILVVCAHNDDQIIGVGGTLVKFAKEGYNITTVIFSYGEKSHPWMKKHVTKRIRKREAEKSNEVMGISEPRFLGLSEGNFHKELTQEKKKELVNIITRVKYSKIFTHSVDDPHPDHQTVYSIVKELIKNNNVKSDIYMFDVWNPVRLRKRNLPQLVVDITETFKTKIRAFKTHQSQKMTIFTLLWNVYAQALIQGLNHGYKYAEVFRKLK